MIGARWIYWTVVVACCFGAKTYATTVQQMGPFELLKTANIVATVHVVPGAMPWEASVVDVIKSTPGETVPDRLHFKVFCLFEQEIPKLSADQNYIVCLSGPTNGVYQCVSYGKQAIWPKTELEWPYSAEHISTFEVAHEAFTEMQKVLMAGDIEAQDRLLSELLSRHDNSLLRAMAPEILWHQLDSAFPRTRKALAEPAGATGGGGPRTDSEQPNPAPKATAEAKPSVAGEKGAARSPVVQTQAMESSFRWPIILGGVLLAASVVFILIKRRRIS